MSMYFGMTGRSRSTGFVTLLATVILLTAVAASAQDAACELPLTVPDASEVGVVLQPNTRGPGIMLTWPEPDDAASTCTALTDTADLGITIQAEGDYADAFDRTISFVFNEAGTVSSPDADRFVCAWYNVNQSWTGEIGGEINLSNSGGLWARDGGGAWMQQNGGLPPYLPYTNLVDLAAGDDGTLLVAVSRGAQLQTSPQGVYMAAPGGDWAEVAPDEFGRDRAVAFVEVPPSDTDRIALGTRADGLFLSSDGGATFTQWTSELDPDYDDIPSSFEVTALLWTEARLLVSVRFYGTFVSTDNGASFTRLDDLMVPDGQGGFLEAYVRTLAEDPADSDRLMAGLTGNGVYVSDDGGQDWQALMDTGNIPGAAVPTILSIDMDPVDTDAVTVGTLSQGVWYTTDGGADWLAATTPFDDPEEYPITPEVWDLVRHDGVMLGLASGYGMIETADNGQTWTEVADQPANRLGRCLVSTAAGLLRPTVGGGIYEAGTPISLTASQTSAETAEEYRGLEFGVTMAFGQGEVTLPDEDNDGIPEPVTFNLVCQDYQGWIVWRSERGDPDNMTMIGRYDKTNPESCIEGFCGDDSYVVLPNCFSERRAACFIFDGSGSVSFFDGDIYNGFTYFYSVTPFDYGDISMVTDPLALDSPMVFPARFTDDPQAEGDGNRQSFQVNASATQAEGGDDIFVYPNPLRRGSGIVGGEGEEVIWTNLPPESRIEVFTLAGDRVAELPEEDSPQVGGNIYWITRNDDNQELASGIYMWRVIMPSRGDYWGKLVIIR